MGYTEIERNKERVLREIRRGERVRDSGRSNTERGKRDKER